jgi:hypothetical protein
MSDAVITLWKEATSVGFATYLWLALIVFVSAFVQGVVGFAFGMIAMGLSTLVLDAKTASFLIAPLAAINVALVLWSVRHEVRLAIVAPMVCGALAGMPLGVIILLGGSMLLIKIMVGLLLIYVGASRLLPRALPVHPLPYWWGGIAGFGTGILGGATNMGGPPIIAYAARQPWSPSMFKATLLTTFLFNSVSKSAVLVWQGSLDRALLSLAAILTPMVVLGSVIGVRVFKRTDRELFRRIVAVMLLGLGVWLLVGR